MLGGASGGALGEAMPPEDSARYVVAIALECALLAFLEKSGRCISDFYARKICHACTGLMLLQLDSRTPQDRTLVYLMGVGSLAVTWELLPRVRPFRFGRARDVGMTVFSVVAILWFWCELPIQVLAPMFFADPAGAIVGKWLTGMKHRGWPNPVWWRSGESTKTVGGSAAVLLVTALTMSAPATAPQRLAVGLLAAWAEALGGAFDNLLLVLCVVGSRLALNAMETGRASLDHDGLVLVVGPGGGAAHGLRGLH